MRAPFFLKLAKAVIVLTVPLAALAGVAIHFTRSTRRDTTPLIAFTHQGAGQQDQIVVMRTDGSHQHALTSQEANDFDPAWSPDGTKIAFQDVEENIRVMNADGKHVRTISHSDGGSDHRPQWSPDGKRIVFDVLDFGDKAKTLYVVNADGTGKRSLKVAGIDASWSPDGTKLVYVDLHGHVATVGANGGSPRALTSGGCAGDTPAWSPDAKTIAYVDGRDCKGPSRIYLMRANGTGRRALPWPGKGFFGSASWSPDGRQLVFAEGSSFGAIGNVYAVDADGSHLRKLTSDGHDFHPVWRPRVK